MSLESRLKEVQSLPEVPAVAHFCSLFHTVLGLDEFTIDQLETALVNCCHRRPPPPPLTLASGDHVDSGDFLDQLLVKLVRGCVPPQQAKRINESNYLTYTKQLFQTRAEELEEAFSIDDNNRNRTVLALLATVENPFEKADTDVEELADLSLAARVRVLRLLTDYRLEGEDMPDQLKDLEADSLRVEPVGEDGSGRVYWYFYGTRLYIEVAAKKKRKKKKKAAVVTEEAANGKANKGKAKEKKQSDKKAGKKLGGGGGGAKKMSPPEKLEGHEDDDAEEEEDDDAEEEEEEEEGSQEAAGWHLVCHTESDWQQLADRLRPSKKKADRELLATLEANFLPEIGRMFAQQEREERLRLLMANKRSSSRIDRRRQEQEERQLRDQQLEEQLRTAQQLEEQERRRHQYYHRAAVADQEKENGPRGGLQRLHGDDGGAQRGGGSSDGAKGGDERRRPAEDREGRKRRREAQQDVLRRWQEMEMDHDYLPVKQRRHFHFY